VLERDVPDSFNSELAHKLTEIDLVEIGVRIHLKRKR